MIEFKFDVYKFYDQGYNVSIVPPELAAKCKKAIAQTTWTDNYPRYADWTVLPDAGDDLYYEEIVRGKLSYGKSPAIIKNLANEFIELDFFEPLKDSLVKKQHRQKRWMRNVKAHSFGLWDGQENLPWHNDANDGSDLFILAYFSDVDWNQSMNGQVHLGKQTEGGEIVELRQHLPIDSTFVVVNNTNPLMYHKVTGSDPALHRYTFGFRYVIE